MTVVPDSIEPVEEWRTWVFIGDRLLSHNGTLWQPGEAHKAICMVGERKVWTLVRGGWSCEEAALKAQSHNVMQHSAAMFSSARTGYWLSVPKVEPPDGYGYALETVRHDAPEPNCSCGVYAGSTLADCPPGDVVGKVKLWGTIVPGTKGSRAEYAYPSELHVPERLANDPALLAFGVPIVTVNNEALTAAFAAAANHFTPRPFAGWPLRLSIAANLSACALNLILVAWRLT